MASLKEILEVENSRETDASWRVILPKMGNSIASKTCSVAQFPQFQLKYIIGQHRA